MAALPAYAAGPPGTAPGPIRSVSADDPRLLHNPYADLGEQLQQLLSRTGALGSYLTDDAKTVVVVPASGSSSFSARDAEQLGIQVLVETRDIELAEIAAIDSLVREVPWRPGPETMYPIALFDPSLGQVEIFSDAPAVLFSEIIEQFPGKIRTVGSVRLTSKLGDYEPHYGGSRIIHNNLPWGDESGCTSGFAVRTAGGNPRMVTAGHCFLPGDNIKSPGGTPFGEVKALAPNWPIDADAELIGASGISHAPYVWNGTLTSETDYAGVIGDRDPVSDFYCFSGSIQHKSTDPNSVERCHLSLVNANFSRLFNFGDRGEYTITADRYRGAEGYGSCNHDSGAPFYRYMGSLTRIEIAGIVFAGSERVNPDREPLPGNKTACELEWQTDVWIMKVSRIKNAFNVTVKTI